MTFYDFLHKTRHIVYFFYYPLSLTNVEGKRNIGTKYHYTSGLCLEVKSTKEDVPSYMAIDNGLGDSNEEPSKAEYEVR